MFIWLLLVASTACGAQGWVSGTGATPANAKAQAMQNASATLPAGVAFSVTNQNWTGDDYNGYTCNITFNYWTVYYAGVYVQPYYGPYYGSYYHGYHGSHGNHGYHSNHGNSYHSHAVAPVPHAAYHSASHASAGHARHK